MTNLAPAIFIRGAVKRYGEITAVDGLDLVVPDGICLGLLGPNGAGKSTTMRLLTGQSRADAGEIRMLGLPMPAQSKQVRALMGVVPQMDNLDEDLTVRDNLAVFAHLYRVAKGEREAAVRRAMGIAQLTDRAGTRVSKLSGGMRRRLLIARGLVHSPRLVLLDEPTVGLDPQIRQELWSLISRLREDGVTTLMSTHYIEEAERLADECALMSHGKVVARGTPGELIKEHAGEEVQEHFAPSERLAELESLAKGLGLSTRRTGPSVSVLKSEQLTEEQRARLGPPNVRRAPTLEDVFVVLTGETVE
ncbi:ABC transporter ATP-binding protein [Sinosporangium siamense]|uniref:ABC transporter n=1 Tax=Sinosporangium siamense TaxID=1367973 RepID=A0A919RFY6_9ACTN|nr:ABC transporter ATP-binding protein [Sinosporangium siamense]GII93163.1 ABC transporter [Sinosporangium siamense]